MHPINGAAFSNVAPASLNSSIFLGRMVGVMFMRVNSRCAHQVRPPPSTRDPNEGVPAGYGRGDRLTEGVCEIGPILLWRAVGLRSAA